MKKVVSMILVIAMLLSTMLIPAMAETGIWANTSLYAASANFTNSPLPQECDSVQVGQQLYVNLACTSDLMLKSTELYYMEPGSSDWIYYTTYTANNYFRYVAFPFTPDKTGTYNFYLRVTMYDGGVTGGSMDITVTGSGKGLLDRVRDMANAYAQSQKLSVPYYAQNDSNWAGEYINPYAGTKKTIGSVGCALSCVAMVYSYKTGTYTNPPMLRDKWRFDGNSIYWTGFTANSAYGTIQQDSLKTIYNEIRKGNPVIVGAYPASGRNGTWHYVVVTGYENANPENLRTSDFLINDPANSSRRTLADLFNYKPYCGQIITIGNTSIWP